MNWTGARPTEEGDYFVRAIGGADHWKADIFADGDGVLHEMGRDMGGVKVRPLAEYVLLYPPLEWLGPVTPELVLSRDGSTVDRFAEVLAENARMREAILAGDLIAARDALGALPPPPGKNLGA